MKNFKIVGFKNGVYSTIIIKTIAECAEQRAKEKGFSEIIRIEEA